ncbi:alpha-ketoisocaproate reductase [Scheffersomyces xylosifermentans]|uniref:alpha-ketoisocaproate reductase n=1 Tax=Scheffersomyces xylosifermentans TaxID=1304137 RepID=UPI00315CDCE0
MTTGSKPKVLFIGDLNKSLAEYKSFETKFECISYRLTTVDELVTKFETDFKDIEAIYGAWLGFVPLGGFRDKILENAPPSLKVISICSVGYDGYDGETMRNKNIILTNVPSTGAAEPVADLVLYNTLVSFRRFNIFSRFLNPQNNHTVKVRKLLDQTKDFDSLHGTAVVSGDGQGYAFGEYTNNRGNLNPRGHEAVIIGFGNIGKTIGKKLSDLGMNIHYVKRNRLSAEEESKLGYNATYHANILDTKAFADLIVIACPATPETEHLINGKVIEEFENPFRIINIGRGIIMDEEALVNGLKSGKVLFAGLDVFEKEPSVHPELFGRDDVILTPHVGASTVENFNHTAVEALKNIENVLLEGGKGFNVVN